MKNYPGGKELISLTADLQSWTTIFEGGCILLYCGTPTFWQRGLLDSCFQNLSESSGLPFLLRLCISPLNRVILLPLDQSETKELSTHILWAKTQSLHDHVYWNKNKMCLWKTEFSGTPNLEFCTPIFCFLNQIFCNVSIKLQCKTPRLSVWDQRGSNFQCPSENSQTFTCMPTENM